MTRDELVAYLDSYLGIASARDHSNNGLQVEGGEYVTRLAVAVDTNYETIGGAVAADAGMLLVHHGLFWGKPVLLTGPHRRRVQMLLNAGCSLYAAHLPLDRHPIVGNNARLAELLGLQVTGNLGEVFGAPVGVTAVAPNTLVVEELALRLEQALGHRPLVLKSGADQVRHIGIISGAAADQVVTAVAAGCDTFITGETSHASYHDAAEYGVNVIYAGHYATETLGVQALAAHLEQQFGLPWVFIDRPTGL